MNCVPIFITFLTHHADLAIDDRGSRINGKSLIVDVCMVLKHD